jgi:hypothetical protein
MWLVQISEESLALAAERAALFRALDKKIQDGQSVASLEAQIIKHLHEDETSTHPPVSSEEFVIRAPAIETPAPKAGSVAAVGLARLAHTPGDIPRTPSRLSNGSILKAVQLTARVLASGKKGSIRHFFFTPPGGKRGERGGTPVGVGGHAQPELPREWQQRLLPDLCGVGLHMEESRLAQVEVPCFVCGLGFGIRSLGTRALGLRARLRGEDCTWPRVALGKSKRVARGH